MKNLLLLFGLLLFSFTIYAQEDCREPSKPVIVDRTNENKYGELSEDDLKLPARYNAHPRMVYVDILKSFGRDKESIYRQCKRKAFWKKNAVVEKKSGLADYSRVSYKYTKRGIKYEHIFYFRGGPYLDMYEYVTTSGDNWKLVLDAYEISCRDKESETIKIAPASHPHSVYDLPTNYRYRDNLWLYDISFGSFHDPTKDGNDVYSIIINREHR